MRKLVILAIVLAGCGGAPAPSGNPRETADTGLGMFEKVAYFEVETPQGVIPCIRWDGSGEGSGAISCDWSMR